MHHQSPAIKPRAHPRRGQTLLLAIITLAVLGTIGVFLSPLLIQNNQIELGLEEQLAIDTLTQNLIEVGKYLLLYEKIFYTDSNQGPLDLSDLTHPASGPNGPRAQALHNLWASGFTTTGLPGGGQNLSSACGGFDASGAPLGTYCVSSGAGAGAASSPVFCPFYPRSALFSGGMLENLWFNLASASNLSCGGNPNPLTQVSPGHYQLLLTFYNVGLTGSTTVDWLSNETNHFLSIFPQIPGQPNMLTLLKPLLKNVTLTFDFYTDSSGFATATSERYVNISASVSTKSATTHEAHTTQLNQSLSYYLPTAKDFSLFMIYPPNPNWSQSIAYSGFTDGSGITFNGKVLYNGNIDISNVSLAHLPIFNDTVILTGDFVPSLKFSDVANIQAHFKKGVITNFSAPRFLMSGLCDPNAPAQNVQNFGGFFCMDPSNTANPMTINTYVYSVQSSLCSKCSVIADGSSYAYLSSNACDSLSCFPQITPPAVASTPINQPVNGPYGTVTLGSNTSSYAEIFSSVVAATVETPNVYGTILGGQLTLMSPSHAAAPSITFWNLSSLTPGLPGIADTNALATITGEAAGYNSGISSPLLNLPMVFTPLGAAQ